MPPYDDDMPSGEEEDQPGNGREEETFPGDYTGPLTEEDVPPPWDADGEGDGEEALADEFPPSEWDIRHEQTVPGEDAYREEEEGYTDPFGSAGGGEGEDPHPAGDGTPPDEEAPPRGSTEETVLSTVRDQGPETGLFAPQAKTSAEQVLRHGPRKLNKQLILYIITGVFVAFIVFTTFIAPLLGSRTSQSGARPKAETTGTPDYYSLVPRKPGDSTDTQESPDSGEDWRTVNLDDLPPVGDRDNQYQGEHNETPVTPSSSGSSSGSAPATLRL